MMRSRTGSCTAAAVFLLFFTWILFSPVPAQASVPGLKLYEEGFGAATWTGNATNPFTELDHVVLVVDHDTTNFNVNDYTVTVTGPNSYTRTLELKSVNSSNSGLFQTFDTTINQSNLSQYTGTYTYRVTRIADGSFSEASDHLEVNRLLPPNDTTFAPNHGSPQSITAYFDDVEVNGSPYDNFSTGFDPAKWSGTAPPSWVTYESGQAKFNVNFNPGRGSYWMNLKDPAAAKKIKATVRVPAITGEKPMARVGGTFCQNNMRDINASVRISGNQAFYNIAAEGYDGNHYKSENIIDNVVLGPVTLDRSYQLSVDFDEPTATFTFRVKGLQDTVDYTTTYSLSGPVGLPTDTTKGFSVGAWVIAADTQPEFDWAPIAGTSYYRVRIYSQNDKTIFRGYATTPPYKLPPGILKPKSIYKYRIEAIRDHQWFDFDNFSGSDRNATRFMTGPSEVQTPFIDLNSTGVETFKEGIFGPLVSFYIKVYDAQGVPDNIQSVKALVPGGPELNLQFDFNEGATCGIYRGNYFGGMPSGNYIFTVTDKDDNTYSLSDTLTPDPLDPPVDALLSPADNALINGTGVTFAWDPVPGANAYEVQIYDKNLTRLSILRTTQNQITLPPGVLKEGTYYRYRVLARREFYENIYSNGSSSPPGSLYDMRDFSTTGKAGSSLPSMTLGKFGVAVFHGSYPTIGPIYNLEFSALVSEPDGIPENIRSVEITFPDGTTKHTLKFDNRETTWGWNYFEDETYTSPEMIQAGTYSFTVTDFQNNTYGPVTETLTQTDIDAAADFGWPTLLAPADWSEVGTTTPTVSWTAVAGASYYRVRLFNAYSPTSEIFLSPEITGTSYAVPGGLLQPNRTYRVRVYAFREPIGADVDVYSASTTASQLDFHFTVMDTVTGSNIQIAPLDPNTGQAPVTMTIGEVTAPGTTTLTSSPAGPEPPPDGLHRATRLRFTTSKPLRPLGATSRCASITATRTMKTSRR